MAEFHEDRLGGEEPDLVLDGIRTSGSLLPSFDGKRRTHSHLELVGPGDRLRRIFSLYVHSGSNAVSNIESPDGFSASIQDAVGLYNKSGFFDRSCGDACRDSVHRVFFGLFHDQSQRFFSPPLLTGERAVKGGWVAETWHAYGLSQAPFPSLVQGVSGLQMHRPLQDAIENGSVPLFNAYFALRIGAHSGSVNLILPSGFEERNFALRFSSWTLLAD